jgi:hypothetical protein
LPVIKKPGRWQSGRAILISDFSNQKSTKTMLKILDANWGVAIGLLLLIPQFSEAQLELTAQLRTRSELRHGTGNLLQPNQQTAFFTSQRTRLNLSYQKNGLHFYTSLQDVRIWGQDAASISSADGNRLGLHEAWVLIPLKNSDSLTTAEKGQLNFKIGRQELLYDDSRLLGNLDWLQQARRHDAIVFKYRKKNWKADLGAAFNQHTDAFSYDGTYYTPANLAATVKNSKGELNAVPALFIPLVNAQGISSLQGQPALAGPPSTNGLRQHYKAMQFLHLSHKKGARELSFLVLADQFQRYRLDSIAQPNNGETAFIYGRNYKTRGASTRITAGFLWQQPILSKLGLTTGFYWQGGQDPDGRNLQAYSSTFQLTYKQTKSNWQAGWDFLSGNKTGLAANQSRRFDPLYGTPHKFWGQMDFFYAGTGSPAAGLHNGYLKFLYKAAKKYETAAELHYFALGNEQRNGAGEKLAPYLGTELDWIQRYQLNAISQLELGTALLLASNSMAPAKAQAPGNYQRTAWWVYLQLNIRPFLFKQSINQ